MLIDAITKNIVFYINAGLFSSHRVIFNFLLAISIEKKQNKISDIEWQFFLKGSYAFGLTGFFFYYYYSLIFPPNPLKSHILSIVFLPYFYIFICNFKFI